VELALLHEADLENLERLVCEHGVADEQAC